MDLFRGVLKGGEERLFKVTSSAIEVLDQAIVKGRYSEDEKLYVRLTMGIG
jgi:hypothetical protein